MSTCWEKPHRNEMITSDIRYIRHQDIDTEKWDLCVLQSVNQSIYAFSWYLNLVSPAWDALVKGDYEAVFPLPWRTKAGIRYIFMPPFTQQLGLFSPGLISPESVRSFLEAIPVSFSLIELNLNTLNKIASMPYPCQSNRNYELDLILGKERLEQQYSSHLRRNLRKAQQGRLSLIPYVSPAEMISLFRENRGKSLNSLGDKYYQTLERLIHGLSHRGMVRLMGATAGPNILMAAVVIAEMPGRSTLLFSATERRMENHHALAWLIDQYITQHAGTARVFDFEGSNDDNLARFYAGFGAAETSYPSVRIDRLRFWQRFLLQIVRKLRRFGMLA